ncbi:hypothetical protein ACFLZZ_03130 [Nanoarchaeota archaeon]
MKTKELPVLLGNYLKGDRGAIEEMRIELHLIWKGTMDLKRKINTSSLPLEYKYYYFIIIQIEEIADHYEYLLRDLEKLKKLPKKLIPYNNKIDKLFNDVYNNFYKFSVNGFLDLSKDIIWKKFETEDHPLLMFHLRTVSAKLTNIAKYTIGIKLK